MNRDSYPNDIARTEMVKVLNGSKARKTFQHVRLALDWNRSWISTAHLALFSNDNIIIKTGQS